MTHEAARFRIVVLASGNGSNFQAVVDAASSGALGADVVGLVTDQPGAFAIDRASRADVGATLVVRRQGEIRSDYDLRLAGAVAELRPDLVILAGWMRLLTMAFLGRFAERVINIHPALPGEFPGTNAIERAFQEAQQHGLTRTGVMVHYVPGEGVDDGPVLATAEVPIRPDDTLATLSERVHETEHALLVEATALALAALTAEHPFRE